MKQQGLISPSTTLHPFSSLLSMVTLLLTSDSLKLNQVIFDANSAKQHESIPSAANPVKGTQLLKPVCALCTFQSHHLTSFLPILRLAWFSFGRNFRKMWFH